MADKRDGATALGVARERFVEGLPRKARELEDAVRRLAATPDREAPRDELRRRLHALYASAQVFRIRSLARPLRAAVGRLDDARARTRPVTREELEALGRLVRALPNLATEREPGRSVRGSRVPTSPGFRRAPSSVPGVLAAPTSEGPPSSTYAPPPPEPAGEGEGTTSGSGLLPAVWKRSGRLRRRSSQPNLEAVTTRRPTPLPPEPPSLDDTRPFTHTMPIGAFDDVDSGERPQPPRARSSSEPELGEPFGPDARFESSPPEAPAPRETSDGAPVARMLTEPFVPASPPRGLAEVLEPER
ncbi:MAG: hypothetical protein AAGH15_12390, partial [Myxococcota bacterium]